MRSHILTSLLLLCAYVSTSVAQMTPVYDSYTTFSLDANNVASQTVLVEGTTTGGCTTTTTVVCGPNGQTCTFQTTWPNCVSAQHYAVVTNTLGSAGGTTTGPSVNPFSYMSYQTTTQLAMGAGDDVSATTKAQVYCTAIGALFSILRSFEVELGYTLVQMKPGTETNCEVDAGITFCEYDGIPWCTPATTPPDYKPTGVRRVPKVPSGVPGYYWNTYGLCDRIAGLPWECVAGGTIIGFPGPPTYPQAACTKKP